MQKLLTYFIITGMAFAFLACSTDKKCPAYNPDDLQYVPYSEGDTIQFINNEEEIFEIFINDIELSDSYDVTCRGRSSICPCYAYAELKASNTFYPEPRSFLLLEMSDVSNDKLYFYNFLSLRFEIDFRNDIPYLHLFPAYTMVEEIEIGSKVYEDVIILNTTGQPDAEYTDVYFNEEFGILRFREVSSGKVWHRIAEEEAL